MYLPRYGCSRWTCFVRSRSGSSPLRPGEIGVEPLVDLLLRDRHARFFDAGAAPASEGVRHVLERPARSAIRSKRTSSPRELRMAASQASATRCSRRTLTSSTISSGSPKPSPLFDLTSQKTSVRPRRTTRSSSAPPASSCGRGSGSRAAGTTKRRGARRVPRPTLRRRRLSSSLRQVRARPPRAAVDLARPSFADDRACAPA